MTAPQGAAPAAKTIRLIHAAMVTGVLLFAVVGHFFLRPAMANSGDLPPIMLRTLLGVALGACALSLVLRRRVPQRSTDESVNLYWTTAATPALLTWAPLEGASLLAIFLYARTGAQTTIAVAAIAVLLFVALNPAYLERR
jgi:hypothetical protein